MMRNYIFLGPPGAGKGTMATRLAEKEKFDHISTGDILREEIKNKSELGRRAQSFIDAGRLVPDEVVTAIVAGRLGKNPNGTILDGFPRTVPQAELLEREFEDKNMELMATVLLQVDRAILLKRLTGRRICQECGAVYHITNMPPQVPGKCDKCGGELYQRSDDTEETVEERLQEYKNKTVQLIDYYKQRGKLLSVPANTDQETIFKKLCTALSEIEEDLNS
ncbi:MAG: adenylate kinase [Lentisphaeria bacterium]